MTQAYNSNDIDKRGYFRIDDVLLLHYRLIDDEECEFNSQSDMLLLEKLTLKARFDTISRELHPVLRIISASDPNIVKYFSALEKKLDILADYIIDAEMGDIGISPQKVNIGAGGVAFQSSSPIMSGALLELRIVLLPEHAGIFSYARVVSCTPVSKNDFTGYKIAVMFERMDDEVRDLICRHVLAVEREAISSKRNVE
jgi:hypothetical protein